ncbi:polyamine transporter 1 [Diaporthe helianthi]|uniref:Polyamine transporter 1 n=1 Tax=Diaporthe helianthi TaxID=158607 RepID=A0A2P5HQX3_DIAHE|nr:polyamine transporter 1 [Diaporthe helianthi]
MLGFGLGPLLWAPLSETVLITRFFGAFFASAPVTNTGGVLGDLFSATHRGIAMAGYALAVVGGPTLGPIVSAAVVQYLHLWRWTQYITGILQSLILLNAIISIEETYPPVLLDVNVTELAKKFLIRPMQLLCTPICFLMALYRLVRLRNPLRAVPYIFGKLRGWSLLKSMLPFLSITLGCIIGAALNAFNQLAYNKAYQAAGQRAIPEKRLPPMMLGSVMFACGQFITAWTARPENAPWIAPVLGLFLMGCGFNTIFQAALNYLVDTFRAYAASAVAANTFLRSIFAAGLPLVIIPLYTDFGVEITQSVFAGLATLLISVPFVFYYFGRNIRARNKWSRASVS